MKKPSELSEDEELIMMARSRWTSYVLPLLLAAAYGTVWYLVQLSGEDTPLFHLLMAAIAVWGARFFARRLSTYLMLTSKRIYGEAGIFVTRTLDVPLDRVGGVYVEKGPIGKITGRGTVTITTAGSRFEFPYIPSAVRFRDTLMRQLELTQTADDQKQTEALAAAIAKAFRQEESRHRHGGNNLV